MKIEELTPDLLGAMVRYNGSFTPEYGIVQKYSAGAATVWVRFSLGDTAAGCNVEDLTLMVPAVRRQDRDDLMEYRRRVERATVELESPIDPTKVQDTPAGRALWRAAQSDLALRILRGDAE